MNKIVMGASAFPRYDHVPRTIVPPLTNGGMLRSMDNHRLAKWLREAMYSAARCGELSEEEYFRWLDVPNVFGRSITTAHDPEAKQSQLKRRYSTRDLVAELRTREGVETTEVAPGFTGSLRVTGPAVVLNVID